MRTGTEKRIGATMREKSGGKSRFPDRGDIVIIDLKPVRGHEQEETLVLSLFFLLTNIIFVQGCASLSHSQVKKRVILLR